MRSKMSHGVRGTAQKKAAPGRALLTEFLAMKAGMNPTVVAQAADIFFSCAAKRETLREPVFL